MGTEGPSRVQESWNAFPPSTSDDDGDWGEVVKVGEGECWEDFGRQAEARTIQAAGDVNFEEEEEDEFGDFGEAEDVAPAPVIHVTGLADSLLELKDWSELEEILGVEKSRFGESDLKTQVELGPDLSSQVEKDETVWRRLEDPASSPGLDYVWWDSGTYNIVLFTLGIDSRIVLDGLDRFAKLRPSSPLVFLLLCLQLDRRRREALRLSWIPTLQESHQAEEKSRWRSQRGELRLSERIHTLGRRLLRSFVPSLSLTSWPAPCWSEARSRGRGVSNCVGDISIVPIAPI